MTMLPSNGLGDDPDQDLMRGRQELLEAINAMQTGLGQLNHELSRRGIEFIWPASFVLLQAKKSRKPEETGQRGNCYLKIRSC